MEARNHPSECLVGDYVKLVDLVVAEIDPFSEDPTSENLHDVEFRTGSGEDAWKFTLEEVPCDGGADYAWVRKS